MNLTVTNHNENGEPCGASVIKFEERRTAYVWAPTEIEVQITENGGAAEEDIEIALRAHLMWSGSGNVITSVKYSA